MHHHHILHYKDSINTAKSQYHAGLISTANTQVLFSVINISLHPPGCFPSHYSSVNYFNALVKSFNAKTDNIHCQLASHISFSTVPLIPSSQPRLNFHLPSAAATTELIRKSKSPSCQLDPLPTHPSPSPPPVISHHRHYPPLPPPTSGSLSSLKSAAVLWLQLGFCPHHSTKTAQLKITNALLKTTDSGLLSILILLNLTVAFATLSRLHPSS